MFTVVHVPRHATAHHPTHDPVNVVLPVSLLCWSDCRIIPDC